MLQQAMHAHKTYLVGCGLQAACERMPHALLDVGFSGGQQTGSLINVHRFLMSNNAYSHWQSLLRSCCRWSALLQAVRECMRDAYMHCGESGG